MDDRRVSVFIQGNLELRQPKEVWLVTYQGLGNQLGIRVLLLDSSYQFPVVQYL